MEKPICAVVGVGPGNGAALARRFAAGGYAVALMARGSTLSGTLAAELDDARAYECDVADATSVKDTFARAAQSSSRASCFLSGALVRPCHHKRAQKPIGMAKAEGN